MAAPIHVEPMVLDGVVLWLHLGLLLQQRAEPLHGRVGRLRLKDKLVY